MDENQSFLEILYDVSRQLTGSLDLHEVLTRVIELSSRELAAERASLIVLDKAGKPKDAVILYKGVAISTDLVSINKVIRTGLAGWVKRNRLPALLVDTDQDERWIDLSYVHKASGNPKSALCVPILIKDQLIGLITLVHSRVNHYTPDHLKLMQAIADIAGIAIYNALLYRDLEQNRNLYKGLFEGVADPIFVTSIDGKIVEFNRQAPAVSGYSRRELKKLNFSDLDDRAQKTLTSIASEGKDALFKRYDSRLRTKSKGELAVEVRVSWNKNLDHNYVLWIVNDISERKQLEATRESMTAMIYHDLRSPLANIISSLELIADSSSAQEDDQVRQLLDIGTRSSAHMERLISSLLDIYRFDTGQAVLTKSDVNLVKLIDDAADIVAPLLTSREIQLERTVAIREFPILLDADMIRRVLINLLENAIRFSPLRSRITIGLNLEVNRVLVVISDQGPGIPKNVGDRIFEKHVRLDVEGKSRGLGMGLSFCKHAVQAHGGTIWVEPNTPQGSKFIFSLPVVNQTGSQEG